jgi:hypothetical protein
MELESRPDANVVTDLEQNQILQSTYKETRKIKSNKMHANGYLARYPTRKELLSEDYQRKLQQEDTLLESFRRLQERLGRLIEKHLGKLPYCCKQPNNKL